MQQRDWLSVFGLAALSCLAMIVGAMAILAAEPVLWPLSLGIILLGAAQIGLAVLGQARLQALTDDFEEMVRERRSVEQEYYVNFVQTETFKTEIAALKNRAARIEQEFQKSAVERDVQFKELELRMQAAAANPMPSAREQRIYNDLRTEIPPPTSYYVPPAKSFEAVSTLFPPSAAKAEPPRPPFSGLMNIFGKEGIKPEPKVPRDHLTFLLEPVVDLATNETEHYRARYVMTTTTGNEIGFDRLVANADRSGLRPSLDLHVTNQALPLLRKLRTKHPNMKIFVPIGTSTLTSEPTLRKILDLVDEIGEPAAGLVFELSHDSLAHLDENGITGLAMLARRGIAMALVDVTVAGLDMSSLRHLGVKFIGIEANSVESGYGVSDTWQEFVKVARSLQFQVMLVDVTTSQQAASASQVARFAAGTFFAPPRRVKGSAVGSEDASLSAAA